MNYELKQPLNIAQKTQLYPFIFHDIQIWSSGAWVLCFPLNKKKYFQLICAEKEQIGA